MCRYERRYIERWLSGGSSTCPATGTVLAAPVTLTPNVALRKSIEVWAEKHARWLLVRFSSAPYRVSCSSSCRMSSVHDHMSPLSLQKFHVSSVVLPWRFGCIGEERVALVRKGC